MKGRFARHILIVIAALATVSCVKDIQVRDAISFAPVASKPTKAIIEGTTYPEGESFAVSAFYNASAASPGSSAYFTNLIASKGITYWETSSSEYWPLAGRLDFYAYSPNTAAGVTIGSGGVTATGYSITTAQQMTTDLCYASATVTDCAEHPSAVPLAFSHALSQVVFRVKAADYYSNVSLALDSLSLNGIYSVGDFNNGEWTNQDSARTYTLSSTNTALTYDGNNEPETIDLCAYLFIPQELSPSATLNVGYNIVQNISGTDYTLENKPVSVNLSNTITEWEAGKKYIYTLTIGMNNVITFTASAVGWQEENEEIIVEEN